MSINTRCTYEWAGRQYSKEGLLKALSRNLGLAVSDKAREFLRVKLGMPDDQIEVVVGLIDGRSLGRFKADGRMLLSSWATDAVAYHEGFHRVFRMFLTPEERQFHYDEFRKKPNWKSLLEPYKADYSDKTEEEQIEEYLADQFSDYQLNGGDMKLDKPTRSLFERLIDFINKVLGFKPRTIRDLYREISAGKYSGRPLDAKYRYQRSADKVLINGREYSSDTKNEFVQALTRSIVNELVSQNSMYSFIRGEIEADRIDSLYDSLHLVLLEEIMVTQPELAEDLFSDFSAGKKNSYIFQQFQQYIETLIGKVELTEVNAVEVGEQIDFIEGDKPEGDNGRQQDDVAWKASFEIDPKTTMSKAIKLILASFESDEVSSLGFLKQVRWTHAFNKVARHLAGVPTRDSVSHLAKLAEPWADQLIERLGGLNPAANAIDANTLRLRNEFIKTFAKTEHNYVIAEVSDDGVKWFDANQDTGKKKVVKQWKNAMLLAVRSQATSFEDWANQVAEIATNRNATDTMYENLLGIKVDSDLKNVPLFTLNNEQYYYMNSVSAIAKYITKSIKKNKFDNSNPPDSNKLFDKNNLDIEGTIEKIADAQLEYEDAVDLMLFSRDKKLYGISQNTHTTTTLNTLNYLTTQMDPSWPLEQKLALIDEYLPDVLNYQTIDRVNGQYVVKSEWLKNILDGNQIQMVIIDGMTSSGGENNATADLNETDLYTALVNLSLGGVNLSIKHSDRSVFYGYKMQKNAIFDYQEKNTRTEKEVVDYLTSVLQDQLATEVRRANLDDIPLISYFKDKYQQSMLFSELGTITKLDPYSKPVETLIRKTVTAELSGFKSELVKWGVIDPTTKTAIGIDPAAVAYHNGDLDLTIAASFANQTLSHLEEMRVLLGDFAFFKTADDFYKRMSTTSGTGELLVNDDLTNERIARLNTRPFTIYNPKLGVEAAAETMVYDKEIDGTFTALTVFEKQDYNSPLANELNRVSQINGEQISTLQFIFEQNLAQDLGKPIADLKAGERKQIVDQAKGYAEAYKAVNENDGQSWMNMFMYREYMLRLGQWSDEMNNLFLAELQILNARSNEDLKNVSITVDGEVIPVFSWNRWNEGYFDSVNTLKSQYAGFTKSYMEYRDGVLSNYSERIRPYTIYKTSYHALWPSVVHGTNLSQMHYFMLKNKVDAIHMGSANKSGAIDVKAVFGQFQNGQLTTDQMAVKENGFNFYDVQGLFNDSVFEGDLGANALAQSMTSANIDSLKDQVRIGNHEKTEIKGSTQSLKILLSNLIDQGTERFEGAQDIVNQYKQVVAELVDRSITDLKSEIGFDEGAVTKLESLVDLIKNAATDRSSPINVIEAIEGFLYDPYIETLPNRSKLENIFYSIITNNVVSFDRPGNSYPQVASTGFEPLGSRKVNSNKLDVQTNDDLVKFYTFEFDEEGNITKVNPAEIIMPLPKKWIPSVLAAAKTDNLVEALDWLNEKIANGELDDELTFKGVRIPNQQLSSNEMVRVKKFNLPTNTNYVIVPSELVVKAGSDMDIDKVNLYWADSNNLFKNKHSDPSKPLKEQTGRELQSTLLQLEKQILLHPRNAHMLLMPVVDDLLKKDAYEEIAVRLKGLPAKDPTTFLQSLTPQKNVEKAIDFVKSKFGVGIVARDITGHAVFQVDHINMNRAYFNSDGDPVPTRLRFEGSQDNYSLSSMRDRSGRIISDNQSQTMNSQVDAGKDPYAVKLGISNQTLNMVMYLNRRGIPVKEALKFVNQPMIQEYLVEQRINESITNKQRGNELTKVELVDRVLTRNGYSPTHKTIYDFDNPNLVITSDMLDSGIRGSGTHQLPMFSYFLRVLDEVSAFNDLKNSLSVDTKGKKDKSAVEAYRKLQEKVMFSQIVPSESINYLRNNGILAPFHDAQDLYEQIYDPFYIVDRSAFGPALKTFRDAMAEKQKGEYKKEKVRKAVENDFLLFLLQNFHEDFSLEKFNSLYGIGSESLAEQIKALQDNPQYDNNPVLKAFFPLISIAKDEMNEGKVFDALRLFERELTTIDVNDFIDGMKDIKDEISEDLYKSIIQLSIYQAGFLNSPFSMARIFPTFESTSRDEKGNLTEFKNDYLREVQIVTIGLLPGLQSRADELLPAFQQLFYKNNIEFLPKRYFQSSTIPYFYVWDKAQKKRILKYKPDAKTPAVTLAPLGNTYMKRYFLELLGVESISRITEATLDNAISTPAIDTAGEQAGPFEDFVRNNSQAEFSKVSEESTDVASFFPQTEGMNDAQKEAFNQAFNINSNDAAIICGI